MRPRRASQERRRPRAFEGRDQGKQIPHQEGRSETLFPNPESRTAQFVGAPGMIGITSTGTVGLALSSRR